MDYYALPLKVNALLAGQRLDDEVDIRKSIHQNIKLVLKSFTCSYRYDASFGSIINKYQAATPPQRVSNRLWRDRIREDIRKNLKDMLQRYETRIKVKDVIIDLTPPKNSGASDSMNIKVFIKGELTLGRKEKFHYPDSEIDEDAQELFPLLIPVGKGK